MPTIIGIIAAAGSILVLLMAGTGSFAGMVTAADNTTDTNVTLSVEGQTVVAVDPAAYNFSGMRIGETNFSQTNPALQLVIKNDGSTNITQVYAHPDTFESEDDNPLGLGKAKEYAAGRFLWIQNASSNWYHAGTLTWNQTQEAGGKPSGIENEFDNSIAFGFYRNASNGDYLWELASNGTTQGGSTGWCNTSTKGPYEPPEFRIKSEADTGSNRDMSANSDSYTLNGANNTNWSVRKATTGLLDGYYIASYRDCSRVYFYRFDADPMFPTNTPNPSSDTYLVSGTTEIAPGEEYTGRVGAAVPQGIPQGETNLTVLTIGANSAS